MSKSKRIISTIIISTILIFSSVIGVFANTIEYNDVKIYISNVQRGTIALRSDSNISGSTYFDVVLSNTTQHINLCMEGGQPIDTNISVTGLSQVNAVFEGSACSVQYIQSGYVGGNSANGSAALFRVFFSAYSPWNPITLNINTNSTQLDTPTVTVSGNTISWSPVANASGYNIRYIDDQGISTLIVSNFQGTTYSITRTGKYSVQAYGQGTFYDSLWSTSVDVTYNPDNSNGGLLSWITSRVSEFSSAIDSFFANMSSAVAHIGEVFNSLTSFLPPQYSTTLWSLAGVLLMFGLFRLF